MARRSSLKRLALDVLGKVVRSALSSRGSAGTTASPRPAATPTTPPDGEVPRPTARRDARRGEMETAQARPQIAYSPVRDGDADPGEIVWAWVPYEDDPSQGKDRPLLVIGHISDDVAALALTSREHHDRHHHALGSGPWDSRGRPSWIKLDRLLRLDPDEIRREGAILDEQRFRRVVESWERY